MQIWLFSSYLRSKLSLAFTNTLLIALLIAPQFLFSEIADASPFWFAKVQQKATHYAILGEAELRRHQLISIVRH